MDGGAVDPEFAGERRNIVAAFAERAPKIVVTAGGEGGWRRQEMVGQTIGTDDTALRKRDGHPQRIGKLTEISRPVMRAKRGPRGDIEAVLEQFGLENRA